MGLSEADFLKQLMATFKVEAEEHLQALSSGFLSLEKEPNGPKAQEELETIFREAHNLKGAARAVNQNAIEGICQALENVLSALKNKKITLSTELFNTLYATVDLIQKGIAKPEEKNDELMQKTIEQLDKAKDGKILSDLKPKVEPSNFVEESPAADTPSTDKTIRVSSRKLDRLLQHVEEMLIVKLAAGQKVIELKALNKSIGSLEKQWHRIQTDTKLLKQSLFNSSISAKEQNLLIQIFQFLDWHQEFFTGFEEKLGSMIQNAKQDFRITTNMVDSLLDETKQVLMQPFSTLLVSFPRMVRDISQSLEKNVRFETEGAETEVDRRILEELKDPLIHLIRNGIDHGIESKEERLKLGKSEEGLFRISVSQASGNKVTITIEDDGKGIDVEKVKNSALKQGTISQKEFDELSEEQALRLIFQSGISTAQIISDLSGRGLGMGIVSEKVEKLGGEIFLESKMGVGTRFKIVLPITLATFRGIHIKAGERDFIMPTHNVLRTFRSTQDQIKTLEGKPSIIIEGKPYAYVHLADALNIPKESSSDRFFHVLLLKAADTIIAIGADAILNEQEVFVKNLGTQLVRVRNIAAATVMEGGKVVPILDPFDLVKTVIKNSGGLSSIVSQPTAKSAESKNKTILITEDSVTARILLKNILSSAGYTIKTAVDGIEALSILKTEQPIDLLITDVEMPRMDGFELTKQVRATDNLKSTPVIICTSLGSQEDRERGIDAGANAYIKKSSFTQSHLLDIVKQLF